MLASRLLSILMLLQSRGRMSAPALADALELSKKLDGKLGEIQSANEQIGREQAQRRADQYAWDMQALPAMWEAGNAGEARRMLDIFASVGACL